MNKVLLVEKWTKKKGSEPWLIEDIAELIVDASNIGEEIGERYERERIIEVLEENLYDDDDCGCQGCSWVRTVFALIKGENR